ncbi:MAG: GNAT family N-acetyltransferase [Chlamydiae bacterium]|nr:GNAT family N-acetyltransferase [Chlamydiota bacterium]
MNSEEFDIRYTRPMDSAYLRRWLQEPTVLGRFPMSDKEETDRALECWMGYCKLQSSLTAVDKYTPCGVATLFLVPYQKVRHHAAFKICVDPMRWRQGIGGSLVKNIKHLAKDYFHLEALHIEVFGADSPLIPLLKKNNFTEFARQENYVKTGHGYLPRICFISMLGDHYG